MKKENEVTVTAPIDALRAVIKVLQPLTPEERDRVLAAARSYFEGMD